eukprot:gene28113-10405_t
MDSRSSGTSSSRRPDSSADKGKYSSPSGKSSGSGRDAVSPGTASSAASAATIQPHHPLTAASVRPHNAAAGASAGASAVEYTRPSGVSMTEQGDLILRKEPGLLV